MDTEALVLDVFAEIGVEARVPAGAPTIDLVIGAGESPTQIDVKRRVLIDENAAARLIADDQAHQTTLLVVADRVTAGARRLLNTSGAGYLDLRGHLSLRAPGVVIDTDIRPIKEGTERSDALAGASGLEVATALLMEPERPAAVRELARSLNRSPSTVSSVLAALRNDHLIDTKNTVTGTDLFWRVAERWPARRTQLAALPDADDATMAHALRLGLDDTRDALGWALTDSAAAAAYGAPIGFRAGQAMDFFVPDRSVLRRATTLLNPAQSVANVRATVRVAPVPRAVTQRVSSTSEMFGWPLSHPVFVALDLAQDSGRGREILESWTPDEEWTRVW
jgi:DNA-binding transcriptional ArsR family regulator